MDSIIITVITNHDDQHHQSSFIVYHRASKHRIGNREPAYQRRGFWTSLELNLHGVLVLISLCVVVFLRCGLILCGVVEHLCLLWNDRRRRGKRQGRERERERHTQA